MGQGGRIDVDINPWPPGDESAGSPLVEAIGEAARRLNELREGWLNPEGPLVGEDELHRPEHTRKRPGGGG